MKVKEVKNLELSKFKPSKILVTIETEDELRELWHRLNLHISKIKGDIDKNRKYRYEFDTGRLEGLWVMVDNMMKKQGIEP